MRTVGIVVLCVSAVTATISLCNYSYDRGYADGYENGLHKGKQPKPHTKRFGLSNYRINIERKD